MNWCIACGPMFDDEHTKYCPLRSDDDLDNLEPEAVRTTDRDEILESERR